MLVGVIADVHSNKFALSAVLDDIEGHDCDMLINAGDAFGYYPWAAEVFEMLSALPLISVMGNHDKLVMDAGAGSIDLENGPAIRQNADGLSRAAHDWIRSLPARDRVRIDGITIDICHGTPDRPLNGRLYPDDEIGIERWLPRDREILVTGHTHHPMVRERTGGGLLVNPGSVGQSRDGDPRASWVLIDARTLRCQLHRVDYELEKAVSALRRIEWDPRSIAAICKSTEGPLLVESGQRS